MGHALGEAFLTADYTTEVSLALNRALTRVETPNLEFPLATKVGGRIDVLLNTLTRKDAAGLLRRAGGCLGNAALLLRGGVTWAFRRCGALRLLGRWGVERPKTD